MTFHWPQIVFLVVVGNEIGIQLARHGQPREGKYNVWWQLVSWLLIVFLVWKGGFFK